jgi:hypothetical protein
MENYLKVPASPAALAAIAASERPFQPDECMALARRAAGLLDTAALSATGTGTSVALWEDEHSVAWLNVMPERRDTGYHDHDGSAVGVCVIAGSVTNEGLPISGPRRVHRYGLLQRTAGPADEASPESPRLLASLGVR